MRYLRKVIDPAVQYPKDTIPRTQDIEPAALWSQNPAGRTALVLLRSAIYRGDNSKVTQVILLVYVCSANCAGPLL